MVRLGGTVARGWPVGINARRIPAVLCTIRDHVKAKGPDPLLALCARRILLVELVALAKPELAMTRQHLIRHMRDAMSQPIVM